MMSFTYRHVDQNNRKTYLRKENYHLPDIFVILSGMNDRRDYSVQNRKYFLATALILVLIAGFWIRVHDLAADPPGQIGVNSHALVTDPAHLISFAANYALYNQSEPFPVEHWQVFKVSIVSGLSYILFQIGEPSRFWANLTGVILSYLGILMLLFGITVGIKNIERRMLAVLPASVFLAFNFNLIIYNRAPLLENGLIFYFGLIVLLFGLYSLRNFNLILMGFLIALAFLTGKIFAITLGLAILLMIVLFEKERRTKKILLFVGNGLLSTAILSAVLFGPRFPEYIAYLTEQSFAAHADIFHKFSLLNALFARNMLFGTFTKLYAKAPFLFFAFYIVLIALMIYAQQYWEQFKKNKLLIFGLLWYFIFIVMVVPPLYRPLRYQILLYLPMVMVIAAGFHIKIDKPSPLPPKWYVVSFIIMGLINWYFFNHIILDFFFIDQARTAGWTIIPLSIIPAVLLTFVLASGNIRNWMYGRLHHIRFLTGFMAVGAIIVQAVALFFYFGDTTHNLKKTQADVAEIIKDDAVMTGSHAPVLTYGSEIKHCIYNFGLDIPPADQIEQYPITHIAVTDGGRELSIEQYPAIARSYSLAEYKLQGRTIMIMPVRLNEEKLQVNYDPSDYEKAVYYYRIGETATSLDYIENFIQLHPENRSALLLYANILSMQGNSAKAEKTIREAYRLYPEDPIVERYYDSFNGN